MVDDRRFRNNIVGRLMSTKNFIHNKRKKACNVVISQPKNCNTHTIKILFYKKICVNHFVVNSGCSIWLVIFIFGI